MSLERYKTRPWKHQRVRKNLVVDKTLSESSSIIANLSAKAHTGNIAMAGYSTKLILDRWKVKEIIFPCMLSDSPRHTLSSVIVKFVFYCGRKKKFTL